MKGCGYIQDGVLLNEMKQRTDLFLLEAMRCSKTGDVRGAFACQIAVVHQLGALRLVASATMWSKAKNGIIEIRHVLFDTVDEGEEARQLLYPGLPVMSHYPMDGDPGDLSKAARERVVEKMSAFVERVHVVGLEISGLTFGRGLMWLSHDQEAMDRIQGNEKGSLHWVPSTDYIMGDCMNTAMKAAFGGD